MTKDKCGCAMKQRECGIFERVTWRGVERGFGNICKQPALGFLTALGDALLFE